MEYVKIPVRDNIISPPSAADFNQLMYNVEYLKNKIEKLETLAQQSLSGSDDKSSSPKSVKPTSGKL